MRIFLLAIFLLFLFDGCSSKKRVVAPVKSLPTWYTTPTQSDARNLYSVGEGENKEQAVANALSNMAATLSVSISSEFNTKSVVREGNVNSIQTDSINEIRAKVNELRITNYQVLHTEEFGFQRFLVEVQSNKQQLFSSLYKELVQNFESIQIKQGEAKSYNLVKKLQVYRDAKEDALELKHTLLVMQSLNSGFDASVYFSKILELENSYEKLLSEITFSIQITEDSKNLASSISSGLSSQNYNISKQTNDKNHLRIFVKSSTTQAKSYGFDLARSAITILVKDFNGVVIGSNKLNITGQSTQGYAIAKENVAFKLNNQILQEGIEKVLGLGL